MPGYFAPSSPIFLTPLLEPPPRSVRLSTASIRRSNDAASNSTLLPENLDSFTPTFKKQDNLALAGETGEHWCDAFLHRLRGEILLKRDPANTASPEDAFLT